MPSLFDGIDQLGPASGPATEEYSQPVVTAAIPAAAPASDPVSNPDSESSADLEPDFNSPTVNGGLLASDGLAGSGLIRVPSAMPRDYYSTDLDQLAASTPAPEDPTASMLESTASGLASAADWVYGNVTAPALDSASGVVSSFDSENASSPGSRQRDWENKKRAESQSDQAVAQADRLSQHYLHPSLPITDYITPLQQQKYSSEVLQMFRDSGFNPVGTQEWDEKARSQYQEGLPFKHIRPKRDMLAEEYQKIHEANKLVDLQNSIATGVPDYHAYSQVESAAAEVEQAIQKRNKARQAAKENLPGSEHQLDVTEKDLLEKKNWLKTQLSFFQDKQARIDELRKVADKKNISPLEAIAVKENEYQQDMEIRKRAGEEKGGAKKIYEEFANMPGDLKHGFLNAIQSMGDNLVVALSGDTSSVEAKNLKASLDELVATEQDKDSPLGTFASSILRKGPEAMGNMLPAAIATYVTKNPRVGWMLLSGQVASDSFTKARIAKYGVPESVVYGLVNGGLEMLFETLGGKVADKLGLQTLEQAIANPKVRTGFTKLAGALFGSLGMEGFEEVFTGYAQAGVDVLSGIDKEALANVNNLETFALGAFVGLLGGPSILGAHLLNQPYQSNAKEGGKSALAGEEFRDITDTINRMKLGGEEGNAANPDATITDRTNSSESAQPSDDSLQPTAPNAQPDTQPKSQPTPPPEASEVQEKPQPEPISPAKPAEQPEKPVEAVSTQPEPEVESPENTQEATNQKGKMPSKPGVATKTLENRPVAHHFAKKFQQGGEYSNINQARKEASEILGKPVKPGTTEAKMVDEAIEEGLVATAKEIIRKDHYNRETKEQTFDKLVDLYDRQPRLTAQTSESKTQQAFSTPAPLAFAAQMLAGVDQNSVVYDSSAGNGMLLTAAATNSVANEINLDRAAALKSQGLETTTDDATEFSPGRKFKHIVINPPFNKLNQLGNKTKTWTVGGNKYKNIDHAISLKTLESLEDDGKAVLILGAKGFQAGSAKDDESRGPSYADGSSGTKKFYDELYDNYNVTDHFTVDGKLYSKQGASFPVDVIVIDGKGKSARPKPYDFLQGGVPHVITSWEQLRDEKLSKKTVQKEAGKQQTDQRQSKQPDRKSPQQDAGSGEARRPQREDDTSTVDGGRKGIGRKRRKSRDVADGNRAETGGDGNQQVDGTRPPREAASVDDDAGVSKPGASGVGGERVADGEEGTGRSGGGDVLGDSGRSGESDGSQGVSGKPAKGRERAGDDSGGAGRGQRGGDAERGSGGRGDAGELADADGAELGSVDKPTKEEIKEAARKLMAEEDAREEAEAKAEAEAEAAKQATASKPAPKKPGKKKTGKGKPAASTTKSPKSTPSKAKTATAEKAAQARQELMDGFKEFGELFKNRDTLSSTGVDPKLLSAAVKLARKASKAGIYTFAEYVEVAATALPDLAHQMGDYLEASWEVLHESDTTGLIGKAGKASDFITGRKSKAEASKADAKKEADTKKESVDKYNENQYQKYYKPRSKANGAQAMVPANHVDALEKALDNIEAEHGDIDQFVSSELGFTLEQTRKVFFAEQVDTLAMAIHNYQKGNGMIVGSQTGVGKGRVVAAMMWYAKRQGKVPVFLTKDPSLYADMMRDLTAIGVNKPGEAEFNPFLTNSFGKSDAIDLNAGISGEVVLQQKKSSKAAKDQLADIVNSVLDGGGLTHQPKKGDPVTYDAIFTTYDQLTPRSGSTFRKDQIGDLGSHAYLILDESHLAGASPTTNQWGKKDEPKVNRASAIRELVAAAGGVMYSSATFAKNPDMMDLYMRAGLQYAVADIEKLADAIKEGGIPLLQAISEMLVEGGLMIRHERNYEGIEFGSKVHAIGNHVPDQVASALTAVNEFSKAIEKSDELVQINKEIKSAGGKTLKDNATGRRGAVSQTFTSIMHNLMNQVVFSQKANAAADEAIASLKRGESPVIAVDKTMGAALDDYATDAGLELGDDVALSFRDLFQKYLDRSRTLIIKKDNSDPKSWERLYLTDAELSPQAADAYKAAMEAIESMEDSDLPVSPIDWIRHRVEEAGYSIAEVTGRNLTIDYSSGQPTLGSRDAAEAGNKGKQDTVTGFNNGSIDAMILNGSGSTGLSAHASKDFRNQKRRHMIVAQASGNIDDFMQMLGRINRSGQREESELLPKYTLLMTDAPTEIRPASILMRKLQGLNASTTADSAGNVSFDAPDLLNQIGDKIVEQWLAENPELELQMGVYTYSKKGKQNELREVAGKATGKAALLSYADQQRFWEEVSSAYKAEIDRLDAHDENPLVAKTLDMQAKTLESIEIHEGEENNTNPFLQPSSLEKVQSKVMAKPRTQEQASKAVGDFYESESASKNTGKKKHWTEDPSVMREWAENKVDEIRGQLEKWLAKRTEEIIKQVNDKADRAFEKAKEKAKKEGKDGKSIKRTSDQEINAEVAGKLNSLTEQGSSAFTRITGIVRTAPPGTAVLVTNRITNQKFYGVVDGIHKTSKTANPLAPSGWTVSISVPGFRTSEKIPISQLGPVYDFQPSGYATPSLMNQFDEEQTGEHEERYIVTGNILAGSASVTGQHGKVVFFTDENGNQQRGILMPQKFDAKQWDKKRPFVFKDAKQVLDFLNESGRAQTADGVLFVLSSGQNVVLSAPASKAQGGKYYLSPEIMAAGGNVQFNRKGRRWEMIVPPGRKQLAVLKAVMDISGIQATADKSIAESLARSPGSNESMAVTDGAPSYLESSARAESLGSGPSPVSPKELAETLYGPDKTSESIQDMQQPGVPDPRTGLIPRVWKKAPQEETLPGAWEEQADGSFKFIGGSYPVDSGSVGLSSADSGSVQNAKKPGKKPGKKGSKSVAKQDIAKTWANRFGVVVRIGKLSKKKIKLQDKVFRALGEYKTLTGVIRMAAENAASLGTVIHEIAHHIDTMIGMTDYTKKAKNAVLKFPRTFNGVDLHRELSQISSYALESYKKDGRLHEPFAEFIRIWVTEPAGAVERLAPAFTEWFEDYMQTEQRVLWQKLLQTRDEARSYKDQDLFQKLAAALGQGPARITSAREAWNALLDRNMVRQATTWVDDYRIFKVVDRASKAAGYVGMEAYELANHFRMKYFKRAYDAMKVGLSHPISGVLYKYVPTYQELTNHIDPSEKQEAMIYAHARHTVWSHKERINVDPKHNPDYNTRMELRDAEEFLAKIRREDPDKAARYEAYARDLSRMFNGTLDVLVDSGDMPAELRDKLVAIYGDYYFPLISEKPRLFRDFGKKIGRKLGGSGSLVNRPKSAVGRRSELGTDDKLRDPIEVLYDRVTQAYRRAGEATVMASLISQLIPENGHGGVQGMGWAMEKVKPDQDVLKAKFLEVVPRLVDTGIMEADDAAAAMTAFKLANGKDVSAQEMAAFEQRHNIDKRALSAAGHNAAINAAINQEPDFNQIFKIYRPKWESDDGRNIVLHHLPNGQPQLYVMDPILWEVATAANQREFGMFMRALRSQGQLMKLGATAYSMKFALGNMAIDFISFQLRAKHTRGWRSLTEPPREYMKLLVFNELVGGNINKYLGKHLGFNLPTENAVANLYMQQAGSTSSMYGSPGGRRRSIENLANYRNTSDSWFGNRILPAISELRAGNIRKGIKRGVSDAVGTFENALDNLSELAAWSDAGPRLAEMESAIRADGYIPKDGHWIDTHTGQVVKNLPFYLQVKAERAAAEATVDFAKGGTTARWFEAFLPFYRATINSHYKHAQLIKNLTNIGDKDKTLEGAQAYRYMMGMTLMIVGSMAYAIDKLDDEEYRESEWWKRFKYWTWGPWQIPKSREEAILANAVESIVFQLARSNGYDDGALENESIPTVGNVIINDTLNKFPMGGGLSRAGAEVLINKDFFRGQNIESPYEQNENANRRRSAYSSALSIWLSNHAQNMFGSNNPFSPKRLDHLMNNAVGGQWNRQRQALGNLKDGEFGIQNTPLSAFYNERMNDGSVADLYNQTREVHSQMQSNEDNSVGATGSELTAYKKKITEGRNELARLKTYEEMAATIREVEPRDAHGRRTNEYQKYIVGLSREALGRPELSFAPLLASQPKLPKKLADIVRQQANSAVRNSILALGYPQNATADKSLKERRDDWKAKRLAAIDWLKNHRNSPYVIQEINEAMTSKGYLKFSKGSEDYHEQQKAFYGIQAAFQILSAQPKSKQQE